MNNRNVYTYWTGKEYKFINILRNLILLHSKSGKGYNFHLITPDNISYYIDEIPDYFYNLQPAHQADFVRIDVICRNGGIWLDSDTLVVDSIDSLFDIIDEKDGFFIKENNQIICNGIFGSKKNTHLMREWKKRSVEILDYKKNNISWTEIGNSLLQDIFNKKNEYFINYKIFDGLENLYPVNWNQCVSEFIHKPYYNYKNIEKEYQPLIALVNSVYKELESWEIKDIFNKETPLKYFINKSINNLDYINLDFIEIGTSNFDTIIEKCDNNDFGISVEPIKDYLDELPVKKNVIKINKAISNKSGKIKIYYLTEDIIKSNNLPEWFKGCNSVNDYHPLHKQYKLEKLCKVNEVEVIKTSELFYQNRVKNVRFLKIDTEGHDYIILDELFNYIKYLPDIFYPRKIMFESNENSNNINVLDIIEKYKSIGYKLISSGYDTIIEYDS